ncbi:MAG: cache domain-containing protein [Syntrophobacteraceae bacterium]
MKVVGRIAGLFLVLLCGFFVMSASAEKTRAELAKESAAKAAATASTKATPELIIEKVSQACELLGKEGAGGLLQLKGKDSSFIFAGTYMWVHDLKGVMIMHPIKPDLDGENLIEMKDPTGKAFFAEMNKVAREKGAGWVDYMWPKPGEEKLSKKVSFVKLCDYQGQKVVLGCGIYDMPEADVQKVLAR